VEMKMLLSEGMSQDATKAAQGLAVTIVFVES
jgi:hypothetical protein